VQTKFDPYENYTSTSVLTGLDEKKFTQWSDGYFSANICHHLPNDRNSRILEIGCGYGRNVLALNKRGYTNIVGIDISAAQIHYAKQVLNLKNVYQADAILAIEQFGEAKWDAVLLLDVLEHLELEYSVELLRKIKAALAHSGTLIVQVPAAMSPLSPHRHGDVTHLRAYTAGSMDQHLRMGGFNRITHFEIPPHIHGPASLIRRTIWSLLLKPAIAAYMLAANGSMMGGIYTANMLTVAEQSEG